MENLDAPSQLPPTYELNGPSFGRPDVDLMFAKWAFNNVGDTPTFYASLTPYSANCVSEAPTPCNILHAPDIAYQGPRQVY